MTGIILSGGENRRMAREKAFLKIGGIPLIERILSVFKGLFEEIIIVTDKPELYVSYDVILVGDLMKKKGPMAGIYSGLLNSRNNYSFVVACDMPYLKRSLISFMMGFADFNNEIVAPRVKGVVEPLHTIYSKSCLTVIGKHLSNDNRRLRDLFEECKVRYIEEEEIAHIDPEMKSFININTPEEFNKAIGKEV